MQDTESYLSDSWFDNAMNQLDMDFDNGYIDLKQYSKMRRELIQEYEAECKQERFEDYY